MKKIYPLLVLAVFLSGCATYKFQKGGSIYDKGYVVSRSGHVIVEYTVGRGNSVPDLSLAKERFKRRRPTVDSYYKKMGYIEPRAKQMFWDPPVAMFKLLMGFFRLPFIAISDYKYEHNPQYREKMDKLEEERYRAKRERIKSLREGLSAYVEKDLSIESPYEASYQPEEKAAGVAVREPVKEVAPAAPVPAPVVPAAVQPGPAAERAVPVVKEAPVAVVEAKKEVPVVRAPVKEKRKAKAAEKEFIAQPPVAVILAKPLKGLSPLRVNFYGNKSHTPSGRVISYEWDFGDGDTSTKTNPVNTYWSTTYGSRQFNVTLTVKDDRGNTASASTIVEVVTK